LRAGIGDLLLHDMQQAIDAFRARPGLGERIAFGEGRM